MVALFAAVSVVGAVSEWRNAPHVAAQDRDTRVRMLAEADALAATLGTQLKPSCGSPDEAVIYHFQDDPPAHCFGFTNAEYARLFRKCNRAVFGDPQ